jgi:YesN/AraC family two-component response regulator
MVKYKILLVDDDPLILKGIGCDLEGKGYHVTTAKSGEKAIKLLNKETFDLVITDLVMDQIDGIDVLKKSKESNPDTMVIILTGYGDMTSAIDALRLNADDYLLKPCEAEEIYFRVGRCLERLTLKRKVDIYEKILPVCCMCKRIRDETSEKSGKDKWIRMEDFIEDKVKIMVTSTYCPECFKKAKEEVENL